MERENDCVRRMLMRCALVGVASISLASGVRADDARIEGSYVNRAPSDAPIKAAIENAVAPLNFLVRPIARRRLKNSNPVPLRVAFERDGSTITIRLGKTKPIVLVPGGERIRWERDGDVLDVGVHWEDATLVQAFISQDGERVDRYAISPNGKTLLLAVRLTSPLLPRPVEYEVEFQRESSQ